MTTLLPDDMYDSIYPLNIPQSAKYVGGYVDGAWPWMTRSPSLFPNSVKVTISAVGAVVAMVGDRETGDLSPASLVTYVNNCRAAGVNTIGYCNFASWNGAQAAFNSAGVAQPPWWIAEYDGIRNLPVLNGVQAVAKQYASPGPYDLSCISDTFLEIVGGNVPLNQDDANGLSVTNWSIVIGKLDPLFPYLQTVGYVPDANGNITVTVPFGQMMLYTFLRVSQLDNSTTGVLPALARLTANVANVLTEAQQVDTDVKAAQADEDTQIATLQKMVAGIVPNQPMTDTQVTNLANQLLAVLPDADAKAIGQKLIA